MTSAFLVSVISYSFSPICLQNTMKKNVFTAFFKVSIDHLFDNLESAKKELLFWEKVWKKSRILDPNICTNNGILE